MQADGKDSMGSTTKLLKLYFDIGEICLHHINKI